MTRIAQQLRALVIDAGLAGEGHTVALRHAGVSVTAICSRTPEVIAAVFAKLGVPRSCTDWRQALAEERPDIVSVATPVRAHPEQIAAAVQLGCHVYADKPLAPGVTEARQLYARERQLKTAIAATWMYDSGVAYMSELVAAGAVGRPLEAEAAANSPWPWPVATSGLTASRKAADCSTTGFRTCWRPRSVSWAARCRRRWARHACSARASRMSVVSRLP